MSTIVMVDLVVVFALFVFMLVLLCFCVATVFSVDRPKDLYESCMASSRGQIISCL